jgi:hypothetical protein
MSHFESSFRGLTGPTKAGLALAVMLSAAMVASSPELSVSSWTTLDLPTAWLGQVQQDPIPLITEKLHTMAAALSPQVETTKAVFMENIAKGYDLFQTKFTVDALQAKTMLFQLGNNIATKGASLLDLGLSKLASFPEAFTDTAQQIQTDVSSSVDEFRVLVVPSMEQGLEDIKVMMNELRKVANGPTMRDGSLVKEWLEVARQNADSYLTYQNAEIRRLGIEPTVQASLQFWDSFETETLREYAVVKQTAEELASQLTSVAYAQANNMEEFKNIRIPEMSQTVAELWAGKTEYVQAELLTFQTETVPEMAKTVDSLSREAQTMLSASRLLVENSLNDFVDIVSTKYAAGANELRSFIEQFISQVRSNLNVWKDSTLSGITQQKFTYIQIFDNLNAKATAGMDVAIQKQSIVKDVISTETVFMKEAIRAYSDSLRLVE